MDTLTLDELEDEHQAFDALAHETPEIDVFCSSSAWSIPAARTMMPPREPFLHRSEHGYLALMVGGHPEVGRYIQPLEAAWCFGSGLIGPRPSPLVRTLARICGAEPSWDLLLLSGIPDGGAWFQALVQHFGRRYRLFRGHVTQRHLAALGGGLDAYLARRSTNFRRSLKKSIRRAEREGLSFETLDPRARPQADALYGRLLAVEDWSWKGQGGSGLATFPMRQFYGLMMPRLIETGALRLSFARHRGRDVGYILGARVGDLYRGLQFSFDDAYRAAGLGNLLQWHQMRTLLNEGVVQYDLGSDAPYKDRWSDQIFETLTLIIRR